MVVTAHPNGEQFTVAFNAQAPIPTSTVGGIVTTLGEPVAVAVGPDGRTFAATTNLTGGFDLLELIRDPLDGSITISFVGEIQFDNTPFKSHYDPSHPGANDEGYVSEPNVNALIESMDMREAQRTYEVNLSVIATARAMLMRTIALIN